jgi:hypothetical protein
MKDAAVAILLSYLAGPLGADGQADMALNDLPLPERSSTTLPAIVGNFYLSGSQIILTFGDMAPEDAQRLANADGASGSMSVNPGIAWIRAIGSISYSNKTLTFTLTQSCRVNPWMTTGAPF